MATVPQILQTKAGSSASITTTGNATATWDSNTKKGSLVVVMVFSDSPSGTAGNTTSVTDSQSNSYTQIGTRLLGNGNELTLWYSYNITAGTTPTVTAACTTSIGSCNFAILMREYSGINNAHNTADPLDRNAQQTSTGTSISSTAATLSSYDQELVIGAISLASNTAVTAGTGFINGVSSVLTASLQGYMEDKIVSRAAAQTATATVGSPVLYCAKVATFKIAKANISMITNNLRPAIFSPGNAR